MENRPKPLLRTTIRVYLRAVKPFVRSGQELTIDNVNKYIEERTKTGKSYYVRPAMILFLKFMGREELIPNVRGISKDLSKPARRGVYLPRGTVLNIVNKVINEPFRIAATIQYVTGIRPREALLISKRDVTLQEDGMIKIVTMPKRRRQTRTVFLPGKYRDVFDYIVDSRKEYPFLSGPPNERTVDNTYKYYWSAIKRAALMVGEPGFAPHDFRRNFISDLQEAGKDIYEISQAAGHKKLDTTAGYINKKGIEHKEAVNLIR